MGLLIKKAVNIIFLGVYKSSQILAAHGNESEIKRRPSVAQAHL